jgi:hypothetical protein
MKNFLKTYESCRIVRIEDKLRAKQGTTNWPKFFAFERVLCGVSNIVRDDSYGKGSTVLN